MSNDVDAGNVDAPENASSTREWSWPVFGPTAAVVALASLALIDKITSLRVPVVGDLLDVMDKAASNLGLIASIVVVFLTTGAITWTSSRPDSRPLNVRRPILWGAAAGVAAAGAIGAATWMCRTTAAEHSEGRLASPGPNSAPHGEPVRLLREHDVLFQLRKAEPPQSNLDLLTGDVAKEGDPYAVTVECRQQGQSDSICIQGKAPEFWIDPIDEHGATGAAVGSGKTDDPNSCHPVDADPRMIHERFTYCIRTRMWTAFFRVDDLPEAILENGQFPENIALKAHVKVWEN
jgi:hypothetical protein